MAAKLRLILKPIHWSLAVKSAALGIIWLALPFWVFLLAGLYLYLFPLFQPFKFSIPFLLITFFGRVLPHVFLSAAFISVIAFLLLGVKDLVLVLRFSAHRILVYLLFFGIFLLFFSSLESPAGRLGLLWSFLMGVAVFALAKGLTAYLPKSAPAGWSRPLLRRRELAALGILAILVLETALVLLFLPLTFVYQTAILFLAAAVLTELTLDYLSEYLTREKILAGFSAFFVFTVILLTMAEWGL